MGYWASNLRLLSHACCTSQCPFMIITCCTNRLIFWPSCFAVTAELMNGTFVAYKECFKGSGCNNTTACDRAENTTGVSFKRCVADCCSQEKCNRYVPALLAPPSQVQVPATVSVSVNATQSPSTSAPVVKVDPTSRAGSIIKFSTYLAICLLVAIQIMSWALN